MSLAWLGHLRYRDSIGFWTALALSWLLVLPEYVLNYAATRYGWLEGIPVEFAAPRGG